MMLQESMRMVSRKPFRRFHNYLLGCAAEFVAPALKGAAKALKQAKAKGNRAAKGKKPKISPDCAAVLAGAADGVAAGLPL